MEEFHITPHEEPCGIEPVEFWFKKEIQIFGFHIEIKVSK